jgi:molybdate transport system substrate-binding protein
VNRYLLTGLLLLASLSVFAKAPAPAAITVFAAASLKESLDEAAQAWTRRSGQKIVLSYAASSALARQIEQRAPADVFISADGEWMDYLQLRRLIDADSRFNLVGNRLVLIAPASSGVRAVPLRWRPLHRALGPGRLAVAETASVPAGIYARQALLKLGLWQRVAGQLAQADNVRAAMAFVALGEAPLGIVYATDARAEPRVRVVAIFDDDTHAPILYPAARTAHGSLAATGGFLASLRGAEARAIFRRAGFRLP